MVVGGLVSTLYLNIRPSTHDVDFFSSGAQRGIDTQVMAAGDFVVRGIPTLYPGRPNFQTATFVATIRGQLAEEALAQNVVVFQRPGLRLLRHLGGTSSVRK